MNQSDSLKFQAIAIGSLPHNNADKAMLVVKENFPHIPFFPQLANVQKNEDMIIQFLEGLPSFFADKAQDFVMNSESDEFFESLEEFFTDYEEIMVDTNSEKLSKYGISKEFSSTFLKFIEIIKETKPKYAKGQIVGPFTLASSLADINGQNYVFDDTLRDIVVKLLKLKVLWQIKQIKSANSETIPIIFIDEPTVSQLGTSAYITISDKIVIDMLKEICDVIHENGGICGVHCCGKCDWSVPIRSGVDILNFDAYAYSKHLSLYSDDIDSFLKNGGKLAWGIVPTLDVKALTNLEVKDLAKKFEISVKYLTNKGINEKLIKDNSIITSSCGAGSLSIELAERAMHLVFELADFLRERE
ncbi:hypothetical protein IJ541_05040 [bacterium]|nr:hypothetical protein [bacterium]